MQRDTVKVKVTATAQVDRSPRHGHGAWESRKDMTVIALTNDSENLLLKSYRERSGKAIGTERKGTIYLQAAVITTVSKTVCSHMQ